MPKVTYRQANGDERVVEVPAGYSVMEGALRGGVRGIKAECGGGCLCATCHVYVAPEWLDKAGAKSPLEDAMLALAVHPRPNSRLSCQIKVSAQLDGLLVQIPEEQR